MKEEIQCNEERKMLIWLKGFSKKLVDEPKGNLGCIPSLTCKTTENTNLGLIIILNNNSWICRTENVTVARIRPEGQNFSHQNPTTVGYMLEKI